MVKFMSFDNDIVLVEQEVKVKNVVSKKEPVNHIWVYDRSGSMYGLIDKLCEQLIDLSKKLPKGDSLTLGWFSGQGDFNWVFKGFRIVDDSDYKSLELAIKKNSTTRNTTCFSEILMDTQVVINDLSVLSKNFSFNLFTDGYPVVNNYKAEIDDIFSAITKIKGKISTAMLIGYGCYYNKELMSKMSEKLGAILIHNSKIEDYSSNIIKLVNISSTSEPKQEIESLFKNYLSIFSIIDNGVVSLSIDNNKIYVPYEKGKSVKIYYLSKDKPNQKSWKKVNINDIDFSDSSSCFAKAIYASTLIMSQQTKTNIAMEIIGKIGDKAIIDKLNSAFMVEEFGEAEGFINKAISEVKYRFSTGRDCNYLPKADAFCVYDALNMLIEDNEAAFFPYHDNFVYEKIGVKSSEKDGYSKFEADRSSKSPFNSLVWNESRLNLSIQTIIKGSVRLRTIEGVTPAQMGFTDVYPTFVFRNYTFIKDGHTHIKVFYLTTSENTYRFFKNEGIVVDDDFVKSKIYSIDIGKLPAVNRVLISDDVSGEELCKKVLSVQKLKGEIKALKWLKNDVLGEEEVKAKFFTEEQSNFLRENCILVDKNGLYSPPTEKSEPVDFYMAKTFEIKLKGMSSLPQVKNVLAKIASNKARTVSEILVENGINLWENVKSSFKNRDDISNWFEKEICKKQKELKALSNIIQKTKMAVIIGCKWFREFNSRENCELVVDGVKCLFELGEEKVGY